MCWQLATKQMDSVRVSVAGCLGYDVLVDEGQK